MSSVRRGVESIVVLLIVVYSSACQAVEGIKNVEELCSIT